MAYILNLTNTTLSVGKYADIKPGKYILADKYVLESEETAYAVRSKWASISDDVPVEISFDTEKVSFESPAIEGTDTYPGEAAPVVPATVEAPAVVAEPVVEAPAEEAVAEPVVEEAPAKTTKAAKAKAAAAAADSAAE